MQWDKDLLDKAGRLGVACLGQRIVLAGAESCTGGLVAGLLTAAPGSSGWFVGGVVAYADRIKEQLLGVPESCLYAHGAVSRETVEAMAVGARRVFAVNGAFAVSGIAGPSGGTPDKPVGTVFIAVSVAGSLRSERFAFTGDRNAVRVQTVRAALAMLLDMPDLAF